MMKSLSCIIVRSPSTAVCAPAFQHEAERALRMAMRRRDLSGQHELHPRIEVGRNFRLPAKARVLEDEHAPLGLFAVIRRPASSMAARMSLNDHAAGVQPLTGSGVTRLASDSHSGVRL
jgi:hypothetical protein